MIEVSVRGDLPVAHVVSAWTNTMQELYRFTVTHDDHDMVLLISDETYHGLYRVLDKQNVVVSTWQSEGLSLYANLASSELLSVSALLGITQARAIQLNDCLRIEDFAHPADGTCLFSSVPLKQTFAEILECLLVCDGCAQFYRCLRLEPEVEALLHVVDGLRRRQLARDGS